MIKKISLGKVRVNIEELTDVAHENKSYGM